ncbi:putative rRNA maturation factor [Natronospira proteinivora]|uniref:Endoribonuclease YbeY n=1 Tax=Natronospira proteinivora TaxID=1807133 RepID=A0ABT1GB82_9GAMM|nr:rRNA maturation RNase YbeY [Natronospira proteinivora]MCP1728580.1 putative rRNA maturation factor [Natronospira proteinivora]
MSHPDAPEPMDDEPPPSGLNLDLAVEIDAPGLPEAPDFQHWAETALAWADADPGRPSAVLSGQALELALRIVSPEESQSLNRQWRDRDRPTNVLSFPGDELPGLPWRHLGDLVICAEVVAREASEQDKLEQAHWAHMLVHGVLHLLGYDHEVRDQAEHMEALEKRILDQLGFPDPYQDET